MNPQIKRAALCIAYDNGMIYRGRTEEEFLRDTASALEARFSPEELAQAAEMIATLNDEQLEDVCCGDHHEDRIAELLHTLLNYNLLDMVLNYIFEGEDDDVSR